MNPESIWSQIWRSLAVLIIAPGGWLVLEMFSGIWKLKALLKAWLERLPDRFFKWANKLEEWSSAI